MILASGSDATFVPRCWRMYLALWLISRWRLPATPNLTLPVAVILKRFLAPDFVFSFGISQRSRSPVLLKHYEPPWHALSARRLQESGADSRKAPAGQARRAQQIASGLTRPTSRSRRHTSMPEHLGVLGSSD